MRLTCPNCGAEYEAPRNMLPAGGRHVQCSACHTRWFARGDARPLLTEEQIIHRLETRAPPRTAAQVEEPVAASWGEPAAAVPVAPVATPPARQRPVSEPEDFQWESVEPEPEGATSAPSAIVAGKAAAAMPGVAQGVDAVSVAPAVRAGGEAEPHPAPRLDLGGVLGQQEAPAPRQSLFIRGLLFATAAFGVLLLSYLLAGPLEANVPVLGRIFGAYADAVDAVRERLAIAFPKGA